jgi:hypothetical protein
MVRTWPNYALYEIRTRRTIPVFRLTPVSRPADEHPTDHGAG